jgi:GT2 family glycosyltransferase
MGFPRVAVVVPVFNKVSLTLRFLESFREVRYSNYQIIIVDDGSTDGTSNAIRAQHPEVMLLRGDGNLWWSGATNLGVRHALELGSDSVLTINNDVCVCADFLSYLVQTAQEHPQSLVGSRINYLEDRRRIWAMGAVKHWRSEAIMDLVGHQAHEEDVLPACPNPLAVDVLTGCGTLVPADCYRRIGLYDTRWCPQYHGDSEFALRAGQAGYRALVDVRAVIWNDATNTGKNANIFFRGSPWYWRPMLAIHLRYCPSRYLLPSLFHYYGRVCFPRPYIFFERLKRRCAASIKRAFQRAG